MGLIDLINKKTELVIEDPNKLTQEEIQVLLQSLKTATLRGDHVELFYSAAVKLQNQYITLKDKK